jgi:excisionase family DNA binding protein
MSVASPAPTPLLIDLRAAAKLLSLSTRTVWQMATDGALPSTRIGRRLLFSTAALERFVAEHESGGVRA